MKTAANVRSDISAHWYTKDGKPVFTVLKKDGTGERPTTLADARKMDLVPSVTTILKVLHKEALVNWLCEQTALAVLTTPRNQGEELDAFVERVLHGERIQDQEAQLARDRGTEIHKAMESLFQGVEIEDDLKPWCLPAFDALKSQAELVCTERSLGNTEFAGTIDLVQTTDSHWIVTDFKTTKKLPKESWSDHKLQLSAYARLWVTRVSGEPVTGSLKPIRTQNVYISTVELGAFTICQNDDWSETYSHGFAPLLQHWRWANKFNQ